MWPRVLNIFHFSPTFMFSKKYVIISEIVYFNVSKRRKALYDLTGQLHD